MHFFKHLRNQIEIPSVKVKTCIQCMPKQDSMKIGESWSEIDCPEACNNTFRENSSSKDIVTISVTASVIQTASPSHPTFSSEIACLPARAAYNCLSNIFAPYPSHFIAKLSL